MSGTAVGNSVRLLRGALVLAAGGVWCVSIGCQLANEKFGYKYPRSNLSKPLNLALQVLMVLGTFMAGISLMSCAFYVTKGVVMGISMINISAPPALLIKAGVVGAVVALFSRVLSILGGEAMAQKPSFSGLKKFWENFTTLS